MKVPPRSTVLGLAAIGVVIGIVSTLRLGAVVAATPRGELFDELLRLADPAVTVGQGAADLADALSARLNDPALFRARMAFCEQAAPALADAGPDAGGAADPTYQRCLDAIDDALRAGPSSGELWLYKAMVLAEASEVDEQTIAALRNSYRMSPREGWIATARSILGLRLYPLLPGDLQDDVRADLVMVMNNFTFAPTLAAAYAQDFSLRSAGAAALEMLPPDLLARFIRLVGTFAANPDETQ